MAMVSIEKDKSLSDCPECDMDYGECCAYYEKGKCIFYVATIQQRVSRACYHELVEAENEARLDHEAGFY